MSGFKVFVDGDVLTAAEVNGYLMKQAVMFFASTAARDLAVVSPEAGMVSYVNSGDVNEGLYTYDGAAWRKGPGWNAPWGLIGFVNGGGQAISSPGADITAAVVTFTAVANRYYEIIGECIISSASSTNLTLTLEKGGASLKDLDRTLHGGSSNLEGLHGTYVEAPGAGSVTYDLTVVCGVSINISTSHISVKDIGPSGAPP